MSLREQFADQLLLDEPLAKYTAARLGGPADMLTIARNIDELAEIVTAAWDEGLPVRILGGGANVLASDAGVRGLVVVNSASQIEFTPNHEVLTASGTSLTALARRCAKRGLTGFEWAVSVPGTVGGAVVNNAGAHGGDMAGVIKTVTYLDTDARSPRLLQNSDLAYDYRTSSLKRRADHRFLVLAATFVFTPDAPEQIAARMDANIAHRKRTQPPGASLGSIFKNPPGDYAGRLIESAGLKGYRVGGAQVSPVHANFFINTGGATSSDYYGLIRQVQDVVFQQTGIMLDMEVELLGEGFG